MSMNINAGSAETGLNELTYRDFQINSHSVICDMIEERIANWPMHRVVLNAKGLVEHLGDMWSDTDSEIHVHGLISWICERFDIDIEASDFSYRKLHEVVIDQVDILGSIKGFCDRVKLTEENIEVAEDILRISSIMYQGKELIVNAALVFHHTDRDRMDHISNAEQVPLFMKQMSATERTMFNPDLHKLTALQCVYLHTLKLLKSMEYRKKDDYCYKEIIYVKRGNRSDDSTMDDTTQTFDENIRTHAWKQCLSIQEFVCKYITKETDWTQWLNLTNPHQNGASLISQLKDFKTRDFPELVVNRYLYSFRNGLYHTLHDMFYPFVKKDEWDDMANDMTQHRRCYSYHGESYIATAPTLQDVAIKFFDLDFFGQHEDDDDPFVISPDTEAMFCVDDIETPELDHILKYQKLDDDTIDWVYIMLGRLLFPVGKLDRWQVTLFFKGIAGSGKSTICSLMRYLFPNHLLGTMPNNIESKFGLSAFYDKLLVICSEVRKDFGLNQADWQSCTTGEEVSIAIKNKTAFQHTWVTPLLMAGNELPGYQNAQGSVDRRIFSIEFNVKVNEKNSKPELVDQLYANIDKLIRKIVVKYHIAVKKHGNKNIWKNGNDSVLPQQLHKFRSNIKHATDSIAAFLGEFGVFTFKPHCWMPEEDFKNMYNAYCFQHDLKPMQWVKESFTAAFQDNELLGVKRKRITHNGMTTEVDIIEGLEVNKGDNCEMNDTA